MQSTTLRQSDIVNRRYILLAALLIVFAGCTTPQRTYVLRGQVIAANPERGELAVKHDDIPGLMPGMTMTFAVKEARAARERVPGDLIEATLVVRGAGAWLEHVRKIGFAALAPPAAAASGFELLKTGEAAPDSTFVDEAGRTRRVSDWRGRAVAITFIYTRCPVPTFCPMMDRHFVAAQREIRRDAALRDRVTLLSISFDPAHDTPAVLRAHAKLVGAQAGTWIFLTGDRDEVDRFAARFGVSVVREPAAATGAAAPPSTVNITHNLRTAVLDADGRLTQVLTGNEWTPAGLLAAIREALKGRG